MSNIQLDIYALKEKTTDLEQLDLASRHISSIFSRHQNDNELEQYLVIYFKHLYEHNLLDKFIPSYFSSDLFSSRYNVDTKLQSFLYVLLQSQTNIPLDFTLKHIKPFFSLYQKNKAFKFSTLRLNPLFLMLNLPEGLDFFKKSQMINFFSDDEYKKFSQHVFLTLGEKIQNKDGFLYFFYKHKHLGFFDAIFSCLPYHSTENRHKLIHFYDLLSKKQKPMFTNNLKIYLQIRQKAQSLSQMLPYEDTIANEISNLVLYFQKLEQHQRLQKILPEKTDVIKIQKI